MAPPIKVDNDVGLASMAASRGWAGDGSEGDPYIIEGYDIDGSTLGNCVYIGNVTRNVTIRNNRLHDAPSYTGKSWTGAAVYVLDSTNVSLVDNDILNGSHRIIWTVGSKVQIINNTMSGARYYGVYSYRSTLTIRGNEIHTYEEPLNIRSSAVEIENNTLRADRYDCVVIDTSTGNVTGNHIGGGSLRGIHIRSSDGLRLSGNDITSVTWMSGIYSESSDHLSIEGNSIVNVSGGISLSDSDGCRVMNNTMSSKGYGIELVYCNSVTAAGNTITAEETGIIIKSSYSTTFRNNAMFKNGIVFGPGGSLRDASSTSIDATNTVDGIPITLIKNRISASIAATKGQLIIVDCTGSWIKGQTFPRPFHGIQVINSDHFTFESNSVEATTPRQVRLDMSGEGVALERNQLKNVSLFLKGNQDNVRVCNNTLVEGSIEIHEFIGDVRENNITVTSMDGITVGNTDLKTRILGNAITVLEGDGDVNAISSRALKLELGYNRFFGQGLELFDTIALWDIGDNDVSNTIDGEPILFKRNATGFDFEDEYSQVVFHNCTGFTVEGQRFRGANNQFYVFDSHNGTFSRNRFESRGGAQLIFEDVADMRVERNLFRGANIGLSAFGCTDASILGNYFVNFSYCGVYLGRADGSTVSNNFFQDADEYGMQVVLTDASTIAWNHFDNCTGYGLGLSFHDNDNLVHHNYFVNCNLSSETGIVSSPQCENGYYDNRWNTSTEGNYWSDYEDRYPEATNDGDTWSVPYEMTSHYGVYRDHHPLVTFSDTVRPLAILDTERVANIRSENTLDGSSSFDNVGITSYEWTIERDGTKHAIDGVTVHTTFTVLGVHRITLRVTDAAGLSDEVSLNVTVVDMEPPLAWAGDDIHADMGSIVEIDGTASSDNHGIASFRWRFEYDGATVEREGPVLSYRFDLPGEYEVTLRVVDRSGLYDEDTVMVFVRDTEPPVIVTVTEVDIRQGESHSFTAVQSTDNVGIANWTWTLDYGDEPHVFEGPGFTFLFDVPGRYTVTLNVTDEAGNRAMTTVNVTVRDTEEPRADAGPGQEVDEGETCRMDGTRSWDNAAVVNWTWSFEHGNVGVLLYGPEPTFVFDEPGLYEVLLVVYDAFGNSAGDVVMVAVRDVTPPRADAGQDIEVGMGELVVLDGSSSSDNVGVVEWTWEFQHGGSPVALEGRSVEYAFEDPGEYRVSLTVADAVGLSDTTTITVRVVDRVDPEAVAQGDITIKAGEAARFDGTSSTDNVGISNWTWSFEYEGNRQELEGSVATFEFKTAGTYPVTLIVRDPSGNEDKAMFVVTVEPLDTNDGEGGVGLWIVAAVVIILAVVAVVVLLLRRGRGQ